MHICGHLNSALVLIKGTSKHQSANGHSFIPCRNGGAGSRDFPDTLREINAGQRYRGGQWRCPKLLVIYMEPHPSKTVHFFLNKVIPLMFWSLSSWYQRIYFFFLFLEVDLKYIYPTQSMGGIKKWSLGQYFVFLVESSLESTICSSASYFLCILVAWRGLAPEFVCKCW